MTAPLWLLPRPRTELPDLRSRHPIAALLLSAVLILAAIPLYLFVVPTSSWQPFALFAVLLWLSMLSFVAPIKIRPRVVLDPTFGLGLVGLLLLGPIPAIVLMCANESVATFGQQRDASVVSAATTNLTNAAWMCLIATGVLAAGGFIPGDPIALETGLLAFAAGMAAFATNYLVSTVASRLWDGTPVRHSLLLDAPQGLGMDTCVVVLAIFVSALYQEVGIVAMALLALPLFLPRLMLFRFIKARSVSDLEPADAAASYAGMIADFMELDAVTKRVSIAAGRQTLGGTDTAPDQITDFNRVMQASLYAGERFDGSEGGFPGLLHGDAIPIESRVVAVARAWALMTAKGTPQREPQHALLELQAKAGTEFDPAVAAAATHAVEQELVPVGPRQPVRLRPATLS